jgi:hypothetical protein
VRQAHIHIQVLKVNFKIAWHSNGIALRGANEEEALNSRS